MRAAPSTMSSGGWKRCSAVLRAAISAGSSSRHPAGVDAVHVDAVGVVVGRRGARHHVQRGLGHVRVRVPGRLEAAVELALHRRHVDDVLVALGRAQHQRLEPGVEHERRDGVDELRLEQLDRRHLGQHQPPRVPARAGRPAAGPGRAGPRGTGGAARSSSSGSSGTCDSSRRRASTPGHPSRPPHAAEPRPAAMS